jgi:hypothetical protein
LPLSSLTSTPATTSSSRRTAPTAGAIPGYIEHVVDVSTYADGRSHTLQLVGSFLGGVNETPTSFMVDDVGLAICR